MTRLSEVVRGVEEKEIDNREIYKDGQIRTGIAMNQGKIKGHNNLASAEVVVDREPMNKILWNELEEQCGMDNWDMPDLEKISNAIATAIESGDVLSLKKEG